MLSSVQRLVWFEIASRCRGRGIGDGWVVSKSVIHRCSLTLLTILLKQECLLLGL